MERVPVTLRGKEVGWAEVSADEMVLVEITDEDTKKLLGYGRQDTNFSIVE